MLNKLQHRNGGEKALSLEGWPCTSDHASCFYRPTSWAPHGISAEQTGPDCYPFSQVEKPRLKEIKRLPTLTQLLRDKVRIQTQLFPKPAPGVLSTVPCCILDPDTSWLESFDFPSLTEKEAEAPGPWGLAVVGPTGFILSFTNRNFVFFLSWVLTCPWGFLSLLMTPAWHTRSLSFLLCKMEAIMVSTS